MLTEPCCSSVESKLTVAELEWPCMTAQSWGCIAGCTCDSVHYFHLLVQHRAQFPECCSRNQILKRQISTGLSIITSLLHLISFLQYLNIYPSHQLVSASRVDTTWLPTRWCHLLATSSNALLMMWMLMNAKSSAPFPGANNLVSLGVLGTKAQFIQN